MIRIKKTIENVGYSSPTCVEMEIVTEGTVLSSSTMTTTSPEGYDVDNEVFNW
jgi:hypothetical protein